jgi:NTE family protein
MVSRSPRSSRPRCDAALIAVIVSIAVVFSAGGGKGDPFHSGVVGAIAEHTGWDATNADLVVGTSAGSFTSTALRAGLRASDVEARHTAAPLSAEGQAIVDRIVTPYEEPTSDRSLAPSAPRMALKAVWPPWRSDPVRLAYGLLPDGNRSGEAIATRMDELLPDGWPERPTWIVAVRTNDGKRIVFGRDDVRGTPGQAAQASSAIPAIYTPVRIGEREYVDGAVHSSTNADLVAMLGFDLVIVSSVKTAIPEDRSWLTDPERAWFSTKLDNEVATVRSKGTPVVVIEPNAEEIARFRDGDRAEACAVGRATAERVLASTAGEGLSALLTPAAG